MGFKDWKGDIIKGPYKVYMTSPDKDDTPAETGISINNSLNWVDGLGLDLIHVFSLGQTVYYIYRKKQKDDSHA